MRKSWLFVTLVLLHLAPVTAHAFGPVSQPVCGDPVQTDVPQLRPAPPVAVATAPPPVDPSWQASRLYGAALLGLSTIVGAGFWNARRRG